MDLADYNSLERGAARDLMLSCCASTSWSEGMVSRRPFRDMASLLTAAEETWWDLGADDWQEAFAAHGAAPEEYADRFGHGYVALTEGRSETELADLYSTRLASDPLTELQTAAREQARVTNLRLRGLLGGD